MPVADERSKVELDYEAALDRLDERQTVRERRLARARAESRSIAREAIPNALGTVLGAAVIYGVAVLSGLLRGARLFDVFSIVIFGAAIIGAIYSYFTVPSGTDIVMLPELERRAMQAELERLRRQQAEDDSTD